MLLQNKVALRKVSTSSSCERIRIGRSKERTLTQQSTAQSEKSTCHDPCENCFSKTELESLRSQNEKLRRDNLKLHLENEKLKLGSTGKTQPEFSNIQTCLLSLLAEKSLKIQQLQRELEERKQLSFMDAKPKDSQKSINIYQLDSMRSTERKSQSPTNNLKGQYCLGNKTTSQKKQINNPTLKHELAKVRTMEEFPTLSKVKSFKEPSFVTPTLSRGRHNQASETLRKK